MCAQPGMIEIGRHASPGLMERKHRSAVVIEVGVETRQIASGVHLARQSIHAVVVFLSASARRRVIRAPWCIGQGPEVIVERVVLLYHDDHMLDFVYVTVSQSLPWQAHC